MLIRSQNKQNIFNINSIDGIGFSDRYTTCELFVAVNGREYTLGIYSSKEKAIQVLDMIEKEYVTSFGTNVVFYMPEENFQLEV